MPTCCPRGTDAVQPARLFLRVRGRTLRVRNRRSARIPTPPWPWIVEAERVAVRTEPARVLESRRSVSHVGVSAIRLRAQRIGEDRIGTQEPPEPRIVDPSSVVVEGRLIVPRLTGEPEARERIRRPRTAEIVRRQRDAERIVLSLSVDLAGCSGDRVDGSQAIG